MIEVIIDTEVLCIIIPEHETTTWYSSIII